jgi:hypothetical protein
MTKEPFSVDPYAIVVKKLAVAICLIYQVQ